MVNFRFALVVLLRHSIFPAVAATNSTVLARKKSAARSPAMHTFIFTNEDTNLVDIYQKDEIFKLWIESWHKAGFDPIILTTKDASKHPDYEKTISRLSASGLDEKRWGRYLRYIAMSARGGGWYSEPYILPIVLPDTTITGITLDNLPNKGKFSIYHSLLLPELLSGNEKEWEKMAVAMRDKPQKNDAALLKNLQRDDPNLFLKEDSAISSIHMLKSTDVELCKMISKKKLATAKFQYRIARKVGISRKQYYEAVRTSLSLTGKKCMGAKRRPNINTFFQPAFSQTNKLYAGLEEWKKAWYNAGWEPIVLTLIDTKRHPDYINFKKAFDSAKHPISDYDRMCFYRWLAMAASGGGWMSDYDTLPLYSNPRYSSTLPNKGTFTSYQMHVPALTVGSVFEWDRMSKLMYDSYMKHSDKFWSDMLALQEIERETHSVIFELEVISIDTPYNYLLKRDGVVTDPYSMYSMKSICDMLRGKRAMHFSHSGCQKVGFCHENRETVIGKWIQVWNDTCI